MYAVMGIVCAVAFALAAFGSLGDPVTAITFAASAFVAYLVFVWMGRVLSGIETMAALLAQINARLDGGAAQPRPAPAPPVVPAVGGASPEAAPPPAPRPALTAESKEKECPSCHERVVAWARVCRHCGTRFDG